MGNINLLGKKRKKMLPHECLFPSSETKTENEEFIAKVGKRTLFLRALHHVLWTEIFNPRGSISWVGCSAWYSGRSPGLRVERSRAHNLSWGRQGRGSGSRGGAECHHQTGSTKARGQQSGTLSRKKGPPKAPLLPFLQHSNCSPLNSLPNTKSNNLMFCWALARLRPPPLTDHLPIQSNLRRSASVSSSEKLEQ